MINQIFKEFEDSNIEFCETGTEQIPAWSYPQKRPVQDKLSDIGLNPIKKPDDQTQPNKTIPRYFYKVYDHTDVLENADRSKYPEFTVTYGHVNGKGSAGNLPTKAIYGQYVNSLLPEQRPSFGFERNHFYAINLYRRVMRRRIVPGDWELRLKFEESEPGFLIRDRSENDPQLSSKHEISVYNVNENEDCGYLYPGKGIIILDPDKLASFTETAKENILPETRNPDEIIQNGDYRIEDSVWKGGFDTIEQAKENEYPDFPYFRNHKKIYKAIKKGSRFVVNAKKTTIKSTYTVEAENDEFNHSLNPSYSDGAGNPIYPSIGSYFTGIGLYNDEYQLLAVAKLEEPMRKTDSDSISIDVEIEH